jgi:hypothetical protein
MNYLKVYTCIKHNGQVHVDKIASENVTQLLTSNESTNTNAVLDTI